jgi:hypothetical protein
MTPAERVREQMRRLIREAPPPGGAPALGIGVTVQPVVELPPAVEKAAPPEPRPALVANVKGRHYCSRCRGHIETHWYQSLLYPLRAGVVILGIAAALAVVIVINSAAVPEVLTGHIPPAKRILYLAPGVLLLLLVGGYICAFLDCVLGAAALGETRHVVSPGRNLRLVMKCASTWLYCFVAGPLGLVPVGLLYWMHCGDLAFLDWLILSQIGVVAVGYWLLAVLAVARRDRTLDANPVRVAWLFALLGPRAIAAALLGSAIALVHGYLIIVAWQEFHRDPGYGALLLAFSCLDGLFWATFLFRLLGVWLHLAEPRHQTESI